MSKSNVWRTCGPWEDRDDDEIETLQEHSPQFAPKPDGCNLVTKTTQKLVEEQKIDYPKVFSEEFYDNYANKYYSDTPNHWEWVRIKQFAVAVRNLYAFCAVQLEQKYFYPAPDWAKVNPKHSISKLVAELRTAENNLAARFTKSDKNICKTLHINKTVSSLVDYAAKALLLYQICANKIEIQPYLDATEIIHNNNLDETEKALQLLRASTINAMKLDKQTNRNNLKLDPYHIYKLNYIYRTKDDKALDFKPLLNQIIQDVGGTTVEECRQLYNQTYKQVLMQQSDSSIQNLVKFYNNYKSIYFYADYASQLANRYNEQNYLVSFKYEQVDCYKQTEKNLAFCKNIMSSLNCPGEYGSDVAKMIHYLSRVIECSANAYSAYLQNPNF